MARTANRADIDEQMMGRCFELARRGTGYTSPNPLVGAVLTRGRRILAEGYHRRFGEAHAEVNCLRSYRGSFKDTTLYVNLEPCAHYGKTPPCVDLILECGIPRVVVAMVDPHRVVSGRGLRKLRQHGIEVVTKIREAEARNLNRIFILHATQRRPYVHVKIAQSLDGRIGGTAGERVILTCRDSMTLVHTWRSTLDAVLVGAGTIRADNPELTVRLVRGRDPHVVVIDGSLSLTPDYRVFASKKRKAFLCVSQHVLDRNPRKVEEFSSRGVILLGIRTPSPVLQVPAVLNVLYRHNIGSVLVEGGAGVFSQFVSSGMFDDVSIFLTPKVLGEGISAFRHGVKMERFLKAVSKAEVARSGTDILIRSFSAV
jgi:diaminohydroxyphosphoribosylaminopyrimidine deaminase/5-amino-6-(5-phosphoribosylamino)uracil reductase